MIPVLKKGSKPAPQELADGFLILINKPADWTSFDVVKKVRNIVRIKKVGHGGTLDPFATGLLVIGVGKKATRSLGTVSGFSKRYLATIRLGRVTDSYDRTGKVLAEQSAVHITIEQIEQALNEMTGRLLQVPPMFSAKKKNGVRLYQLARKQKQVEREPVPVTIYKAQIIDYSPPDVTLDLKVSKGTYIRSYAHDLGQKLGVGGSLEALERTEVNDFYLTDSFTVAEFEHLWNREYSGA